MIDIEEMLDMFRRIGERGRKRALEREDSEFVDVFQHLLDEVERYKEVI